MMHHEAAAMQRSLSLIMHVIRRLVSCGLQGTLRTWARG